MCPTRQTRVWIKMLRFGPDGPTLELNLCVFGDREDGMLATLTIGKLPLDKYIFRLNLIFFLCDFSI